MSVPRVLVVGEVNPYGSDPSMALYHLPREASGNRLRVILGMTDHDYSYTLDKKNLCIGRWDNGVAQREAHRTLSYSHEVMVLLGSKVRGAFNGPPPFTISGRRGKLLVGLPHPSGLCRVWNERDSRERARAVVKLAAHWLRLGVDT